MTRPSLVQLVLYFLKLGATGFGGPVALANYMRADLFERRKWFSDDEYGQGLAIATALPGPMAYKLAKEGRLRLVKIGGRSLILHEDAEALLRVPETEVDRIVAEGAA